ncbi:hypothetical protein J2T17_000349 [Paenibacillus mucilaginosus]
MQKFGAAGLEMRARTGLAPICRNTYERWRTRGMAGRPAAARMSDIYPLIVGISTLKIWGNYPIIEERSMKYGIPK